MAADTDHSIVHRCPRCAAFQPSAFDCALHYRGCAGAEGPDAPIALRFRVADLRSMMQTLEARLDRWRRVIAARNGARANDALEDSIVAGVRAMALTRGLTVGKPVDARIEIFTSESLLRQLAPGMRVARCGAVRVVVYRGEARLERLMSGQDGALRWRTLAPGRWDGRRLVVRPGFDATAIGELERRLQPRLRGAA